MDDLCSAMENLSLSDSHKSKSTMSQERFNRIKKPKSKLRCWKCKKIGHLKKQCKQKHSMRVKRKLKYKRMTNKRDGKKRENDSTNRKEQKISTPIGKSRKSVIQWDRVENPLSNRK